MIVPVVLQAMSATAAWLGADSVRRALLDAYRVEELSAAKEQIEDQQRRLQRGIAHIQQVHAAVAHGQWDARAQVEATELMPVAVSLNLLLDRISRLTRDQEPRQRVDRSAHELAQTLRRLRNGEGYEPPAYTGTPFDEVLVELNVLRNARPEQRAVSQGSAPAWPSIAEPPRSEPPMETSSTWKMPDTSAQPAPSDPGASQSWPAIHEAEQPPLPQWLREK